MRILSHLCRVLANRVIRSLENPMPLLHSLLFVPGDRPDRMEKALGLGADALILDLEDAVAPDAKPAAREAVAAFLGTPRRSEERRVGKECVSSWRYRWST